MVKRHNNKILFTCLEDSLTPKKCKFSHYLPGLMPLETRVKSTKKFGRKLWCIDLACLKCKNNINKKPKMAPHNSSSLIQVSKDLKIPN